MFLLEQLTCFRASVFVFCVFRLYCCLVVSTSAIDCLERLVSEMTYYVLSGTLNPTHSLNHSQEWAWLRFDIFRATDFDSVFDHFKICYKRLTMLCSNPVINDLLTCLLTYLLTYFLTTLWIHIMFTMVQA